MVDLAPLGGDVAAVVDALAVPELHRLAGGAGEQAASDTEVDDLGGRLEHDPFHVGPVEQRQTSPGVTTWPLDSSHIRLTDSWPASTWSSTRGSTAPGGLAAERSAMIRSASARRCAGVRRSSDSGALGPSALAGLGQILLEQLALDALELPQDDLAADGVQERRRGPPCRRRSASSAAGAPATRAGPLLLTVGRRELAPVPHGLLELAEPQRLGQP